MTVAVVRAGDSGRDRRRAAAAPALLAVVLGALRTGVVPVLLDPALDVGTEPVRRPDLPEALDL